MAPPKTKPAPQSPENVPPVDAETPRAGSVASSSPQAVIIEARLASHVASALPTLGTATTLRLAGSPGAYRGGKVVDAMKLTPRGLEVVSGGERIIIGSGSWVALIEADR